MDFITLDVTTREATGKGASRRLRRANLVPGVIYGQNSKSQTVSLVPSDLVKALTGPLRINTPLSITVTDAKTKKTTTVLALVKDHQYDPITRELLHVDFLSITEHQHVEVVVPVVKTGRSVGERLGGVLRMIRRSVSVLCTADNIPEAIHIDASKLENNITLHVSEVETPEGVTINLPPTKAILTISAIIEDEDETTETDAD